jgi:hypothetical protein
MADPMAARAPDPSADRRIVSPAAEQTRGPASPGAGGGTALLLSPASASHPVLPTGTVTFQMTDIEGSTRLLQALGNR